MAEMNNVENPTGGKSKGFKTLSIVAIAVSVVALLLNLGISVWTMRGSKGKGSGIMVTEVKKTGTVDNTDTYTVYFSDGTEYSFDVTNGKDGQDGQDGQDGANGKDGANGQDGQDGADGQNGLNGKDGEDGQDGLDGKDGQDGLNGQDGKDGQNGKDGLSGQDGQDGKDGKDGKDAEVCEHTFENVATVEVSCDHIGFTLQKCSKCGELRTTDEVTELLEHDMVTRLAASNGSAVRVEYCTRCGAPGKHNDEAVSGDYSKYDNLIWQDLEGTFREDVLVHSVDNGRDTATSYWSGSYGESGVTIEVMVTDPLITIDGSNIGLSDNIEFYIQAVNSNFRSYEFYRDFLCTADGRYWLNTVKDDGSRIFTHVPYTPAPGNFSYEHERFEGGYRVKVFFSYSDLGVSREEAVGNIRFCPGMRNRSGTAQGFSWCYLLGEMSDRPNTWFVLDSDNTIARKDFEEFRLSDVSDVAKEALSDLAILSSTDERYKFYKTEPGAMVFYSSQLGFEESGLAADLFGTTSFLRAAKHGYKAKVETSGWVIAVGFSNKNNGDPTIYNTLTDQGWICVAQNCPNPVFMNATSDHTALGNIAAYYAKHFESGETISMPSGAFESLDTVLFCGNKDGLARDPWFTKPAYISRSAVNDPYYQPDINTFTIGSSVTVTKKGRIIAAMGLGGDTTFYDSIYLAYSDDGGDTWEPLFIIDTWNDQKIGGTKDTVAYDSEVVCDPDTNVLYICYGLRRGVTAVHDLTAQCWTFCVQNPDDDPLQWKFNNEPDGSGPDGWHTVADSEQIGKNAGLDWIRNRWTILSDGSYVVIPNHPSNSRFSPMYKSDDKGKTWREVGSVYMPQGLSFDEPRIVELNATAAGGEHVLWATFRVSLGYIVESFSYDGGKTWTIAKTSDIKNPDTRFDFVKLKSGKIIMVHSDSSTQRIGMTVAVSEDDGKTFTNKLSLYPGYATYPEIALQYDADGNEIIHVIFDDNRYYSCQWRIESEGGKTYQTYAHIHHIALTEDEIMKGGDPDPDKTELLAVGDSYTDNNQFWLAFNQAFGTYGGESIGISGSKVGEWNNANKLNEIAAKNPEKIFVNIGINDIRANTDPTTVGNRVVDFLKALHKKLPDADIYYNMLLKITEASNKYHTPVDAANAIIKAYIDSNEHGGKVHAIDIMPTLTAAAGSSDISKYFADGLHLNVNGYAILNEAITKATGIGISVEELNTIYRCRKQLPASTISAEYAAPGDAEKSGQT